MPALFCYIGLPGSGKTFTAERDKEFLDRLGYTTHLLDDVSLNGGKEKLMELLKQPLEVILITDPHLCKQSAQEDLRKLLEQYQVQTQDWWYFENDRHKAYENCKLRNNSKKDIALACIKEFSRNYFIPPGTKTLPIWQKEKRTRNAS